MRRWGVAALLCFLASTSASTTWTADARAQTAPEATARRLFDEGKELEDKGEFGAALGKYKEAEASFATAGVVFHKGFCLEMTGKLREALDAYDKALAAAKTENKPAVEKATLARLEPLQARVPSIVVKATKIDGLTVQLDGAPLDKGQLDGKPLRVDAGPHEITATAPGHRSFAKQVRSQEGGSITVDVALERAPQNVEPPREQGRTPSYAVPLATTIGAVILATGGVVTFVLAGSAASDAEADCPTKVSCDDEQKKVRTFDAVALGAFTGAAALGTISVVLWTTRGSSSSAAAKTRLVASPTTFGLTGSF